MWDFLKNWSARSIDLEALKKDLDKNGFVILKKFFSASQLGAFDSELHNILENRKTMGKELTIYVLEGPLKHQRMKLSDAPDEALLGAHKINDLYLESASCRNLNLNKKLREILKFLFGDYPLVINSLTLRKGSQQPHHFDYYYMPPPVGEAMLVSSICLEDQKPGSGLLGYYPGSHKIPPYRFSNGGIAMVTDEYEAAREYAMAEIEKRGLRSEVFTGAAGDVFIWHGCLYHGGLPIENSALTRKTLVTHYWRVSDVSPDRVGTTDDGGQYFLKEHQRV
jgi:ectoine hydroxylase-related dioxygenase (phytanoyl-CoA dioxygenase family)